MFCACHSSEPDEEWEGISAYRYCWLHPKITNHSGKPCNFEQIARLSYIPVEDKFQRWLTKKVLI